MRELHFVANSKSTTIEEKVKSLLNAAEIATKRCDVK
jgi:hypothetical protein